MSGRHGRLESSFNRCSVKATDHYVSVQHELSLAAQIRIDDVKECTKLSVRRDIYAYGPSDEIDSNENVKWFPLAYRSIAVVSTKN